MMNKLINLLVIIKKQTKHVNQKQEESPKKEKKGYRDEGSGCLEVWLNRSALGD